MARGRSGSRQMGRAISVSSLANPLSALLSPSSLDDLSLSAVEDGRSWHPDPEQGALTIGGRFARVVVHSRPVIARSKPIWAWKGMPAGVQVPVGVRFESPFKVITCMRRKIRREVIFALNKGGKGVKRRRGRRSWRSNVSC